MLGLLPNGFLFLKLSNNFKYYYFYYIEWQNLEMPGIEPGAFHMQSERSTTELHPLLLELMKLSTILPVLYNNLGLSLDLVPRSAFIIKSRHKYEGLK